MTELSYQLYSARKFPPLADRLRVLSSLGYTQVEGYGGLYADLDPADLRRQLDALGLTMPTAHVGLDDLENVEATLAVAGTLGITTIYCPWAAPETRSGRDAGWQTLAARLSGFADAYGAHGIGFGWHNHDFEFTPTESGALPLDILLGSGKLQWEADLAWLVKAGQDPAAWIAKYSGQLSAVHVKDIAPAGEAANEDGWADIGFGTMDWTGLMKAAKATACKYFIMEHDNPSDPDRFAERSIKSLRAMGH